MLAAVNFYNQFAFKRNKINDVFPNGRLSTKLNSLQFFSL